MNINEALDALERAETVMTRTPWTTCRETQEFGTIGNPVVGHYHKTELVAGLACDWGDELADPKSDMIGIALLRNAAPALIACARALEEVLNKYGCMGIGRDALANLVTAVRNQHPA